MKGERENTRHHARENTCGACFQYSRHVFTSPQKIATFPRTCDLFQRGDVFTYRVNGERKPPGVHFSTSSTPPIPSTPTSLQTPSKIWYTRYTRYILLHLTLLPYILPSHTLISTLPLKITPILTLPTSIKIIHFNPINPIKIITIITLSHPIKNYHYNPLTTNKTQTIPQLTTYIKQQQNIILKSSQPSR